MRPDCVFEPDSVAVLCVECEKPTGLVGTCQEIDFCAACKERHIQAAQSHGETRARAEANFSAMLIGMIEGARYKAKYARRQRVLHIAVGGGPACGARGGPHPLTNNPTESNCKRCLAKE